MKVGYKSDVGKSREHNEDSLFVDETLGLFIVADGMGGHQGGEVASQMAVEAVSEFLKSRIPFSRDKEVVYKLIMDALYTANEKISKKAKSDVNLKGMGTTIVLALSCDKDLYIANVGDSRAYLIQKESIKQLTEDHTVVMQMVKAGMLTAEKAKTHHLRHTLSQALGTSDYLIPDIASFNWKKGDYFLLCSDGLTDMLDEEEILSTVFKNKRKPEKGCEMLIELANKKGGNDNITVILLYRNV